MKHVAREAEANRGLRGVARAGYAANGCVHILVGVIVLVVAFGGDGETDQAGALKAIGAAPLGFLALWALAIALLGLGLYHLLEGVLAWGGDAARKWGRRVSEWGQALVFIALGFSIGTGSSTHLGEVAGPVGGVTWLLALIPVMFTYSGWNAAAYLAANPDVAVTGSIRPVSRGPAATETAPSGTPKPSPIND